MTADALKTLLETPAALFLIMLLGSLASALKQISDSRRNGSGVSCAEYLAHWPETIGTVIVNALGFLTLLVTDQLNFASALGIGYAANSASDLLRTGGRSAAVAQTNKQAGHATLMFLTFIAMTFALLTACASLGLQTPKTFDERYAYARQETIAVRESCTASLDARLITSADNAYCIDVADRSSNLLTIAREAQRLGDIATADSRLALVSGVLAELETYLQSRASK